MLSNKKTSTQLSLEKEERERRELHKIMMGTAGQEDGKEAGPRRQEGQEEEGRRGRAPPVRTRDWGREEG